MNTYELLNLYPHNIKTCQKVKEAFANGKDVVSIIKATGTGKSYIGLNLVLENKNKKIIWLVPTNAIKEHIEQTIDKNPYLTIEKDFSNLEIRTYSSLINLSDEELESIPCDLLIVDELHHIGAPVWGEKVNSLIYTHQNIKTFGMSAYSVRDRGTSYERDMTNPDTEEIFSNTIVDRYDLYDAIIDGVLPLPIAKTVLTKDSSIFEELQDALKVKKTTKKEIQNEIEKQFTSIIKTIHKQNSIKDIIQSSINETGKYIYFCPVLSNEGINDIETIKDEVVSYIKEKYPNKKIVVYKTTSDMGIVGKYNRDCFYRDVDLEGNNVSNAIRIMFAKNQYNEGIHAPNVDGVFMGRKTKSDIVALEQIGRTLSVREDIKKRRIEYNLLDVNKLRELAKSQNIMFDENTSKESLIELLLSPIIIDLTGNIEFLEELENNLKNRIKKRRNENSIKKERLNFLEEYSLFCLDHKQKSIITSLLNLKNQVLQSTWEDYYNLAVIYYNHYGNSDIPTDFKTRDGISYDNNGVNLGVWCHTQRQNNLTEERKQKLNLINFRFENKFELDWQKKYNLLVNYYNYYGNSNVPINFKTKDGINFDSSGEYLGKWCDHQKQKYKKKTLSEERIQKLNKINFIFEDKTEINWQKMYDLAKKYYEHYGHSEIPKKFKTTNGIDYDENGVSLGSWCDNQRTKKEILEAEKIKKLKLIKFRFESKIELYWQKMYNLAKKYYEHYGHLEVPSKFKTTNGVDYDRSGETLGSWKENQRTMYRIGTLEEEKIQKLNQINFNFESNQNKIAWEKMYDLAKKYYDHYGNTSFSDSFKTTNGIDYDEQGEHLGVWCKGQRKILKNYELGTNSEMDLRIQKLNSIQFIFDDKRDFYWQKMYNLAKKYYEHYGHSEIKRDFKTQDGIYFNEQGEALGNWCHNLRISLKKYEFGKNKVTDERVKKLEQIEFRLHNRKNSQKEIIELCNTYNIDFNKHKILEKISYQELFAKIMYLLSNNLPLEKNGELHPIFAMCNENMMIHYGINKEELIVNYCINMKGKKQCF